MVGRTRGGVGVERFAVRPVKDQHTPSSASQRASARGALLMPTPPKEVSSARPTDKEASAIPYSQPHRFVPPLTSYFFGSFLYLVGSCCYTASGFGAQLPGERGASSLWTDLATAGNLTFVIGSVLFTYDGLRQAQTAA